MGPLLLARSLDGYLQWGCQWCVRNASSVVAVAVLPTASVPVTVRVNDESLM